MSRFAGGFIFFEDSLRSSEGYLPLKGDMTVDSARPSLTDVYTALAAFAESAEERGVTLFAASAKPMLRDKYAGFSERAYGFSKFIDLLTAGAEGGFFAVELSGGHPCMRAVRGASAQPAEHPPSRRIRGDLWTAVVTWGNADRRWDIESKRAVVVPLDEEGHPAWESSPDRFRPIVPVSMDEQLEWMREFAAAQPADKQHVLFSSLADGAPGTFKRALGQTGLENAWTATLQDRVTSHVLAWASEHELAADSVFEDRKKATPSARRERSRLNASPEAAPPAREATDLRARLHKVIDQMSLAELAQLQVPASYLLTF